MRELLTEDVNNVHSFMDRILQDGGKKFYSLESEIRPFRNVLGYSGYEYESTKLRGQIAIGIILGGTGYILRRYCQYEGQNLERFDYFNLKGEITFTADKEALKPIIVDSLEMDLTCPFLNHLYNFLSYEYRMAGEGQSQTGMVHSVELYLKKLYLSSEIRLAVQSKTNDSAVINIYNKMLQAEMDPVLTWEERQVVFSNYKATLNKILKTKLRAHRLSPLWFKTKLLRKSFGNFFTRFLSRPGNNFNGLLHRYTIGKIIWFLDTVKNNLGYSIALAVYGPFTYYFITMPMNPHAMQAVGKVRSAYLEVKNEVSQLLTQGNVVLNDMSSKEAIASESPKPQAFDLKSDTVKTISSGVDKNTNPKKPELSHIIYASKVTAPGPEPLVLKWGNGSELKVQPSFMNMLISTDVEKVNQQSWMERMSNFKQMEIAYEENIEYASRMGRLEQLETQYNFPMQVENTWEELERYNNLIFKIRQENPNLSAKMKQFLFNEISRTQQLQVYLWDRLGRFILDQIYVMLDQDKEQKRSDYYVGRSFVFMQEMTNILTWRYKDLKKPKGYERIEELANFYSKARKEYGSVMKNLEANSDLFKQKDVYNTHEFRSYMKRQWEILFLQNAKAEEASNMGLNMYIWSVRNTIWALQSIYSAKREELPLLIKRDTTGQLFSSAEMLARSKISLLYETLFHNLTLEFVGIKEEIMNRLGKDIESKQRMVVIENLKEFFSDREKLDGVGVANNEQSNTGATL